MPTVEERLGRLEDESAIRTLCACYADAATRLNLEAFRSLWTADGAWIINAPFQAEAHGAEEIVTLLKKLRTGQEFFVQFVHSGVIEISGTRATARWLMREAAKGPSETYYQNFAFYSDVLEKTQGEWRFARRTYDYLFVDETFFPGRGFLVPSDSPEQLNC